MELILIHINMAAAVLLGHFVAVVRSRWFQARRSSTQLQPAPLLRRQPRLARHAESGLRAADMTIVATRRTKAGANSEEWPDNASST